MGNLILKNNAMELGPYHSWTKGPAIRNSYNHAYPGYYMSSLSAYRAAPVSYDSRTWTVGASPRENMLRDEIRSTAAELRECIAAEQMVPVYAARHHAMCLRGIMLRRTATIRQTGCVQRQQQLVMA